MYVKPALASGSRMLYMSNPNTPEANLARLSPSWDSRAAAASATSCAMLAYFGLELIDLGGGGVVSRLNGSEAHAREREGRAREEPNKLGQTHMRSLLVSGRGSDVSPTSQ